MGCKVLATTSGLRLLFEDLSPEWYVWVCSLHAQYHALAFPNAEYLDGQGTSHS
jgi:hypothetical protein